MPAIHIIKNDPKLPQIKPVELGSNVFRSGYWVIAESKAKALVGGKIYFHEQRAKPSFYGGVIREVEKVEQGERAGRIIFIFEFDEACRGVTTSREGWAQEMKIIL